MNNKYLLILGGLLIAFGLLNPNILSSISIPKNTTNTQVVEAPSDTGLYEKAKAVVNVLEKSSSSTKYNDCMRLSSLYNDMSILISLNDDNPVIKDTTSIREANILVGRMLGLDLKDKYPDLAEAVESVVLYSLGDDEIVLDDTLRAKGVDAFKALSWAFYKGSK